MKTFKILVVGAGGQLGQCLQRYEREENKAGDIFLFRDRHQVDVTDPFSVRDVIDSFQPDYLINASAYTAVDLAEKEEQKARKLNVEAVKHMAEACKEVGTTLVHISTDYIFNGESYISYSETDWANPIGIYGKTKLEGEEILNNSEAKYFIFRTSWVFSEFGKNFVKTILHLMKEKNELGIVSDQVGNPTYGMDLARFIMKSIHSALPFGTYHLTNEGKATWFELASEIRKLAKLYSCELKSISTDEYPTPALRPKNSSLSTDLLYEKLGEVPRHWSWALEECLEHLDNDGASMSTVLSESSGY